MEIVELKNKITEIKNSICGFNQRINNRKRNITDQ